jgi:hypothetical protein
MWIIGSIVGFIRQGGGHVKPRLDKPHDKQDGGEEKQDDYRKTTKRTSLLEVLADD